MKWEKCSDSLSDILETALGGSAVQKRIMFGCPAYFANGNMAAGVHGSGIFIRLSAADREMFLHTHDQAGPFEPVAGHVMKDYVSVPSAVYDHVEQFHPWLDKALRYAATLPPKKIRAMKSKKEKPDGSRNGSG